VLKAEDNTDEPGVDKGAEDRQPQHNAEDSERGENLHTIAPVSLIDDAVFTLLHLSKARLPASPIIDSMLLSDI
jgi:hypothetical protein